VDWRPKPQCLGEVDNEDLVTNGIEWELRRWFVTKDPLGSLPLHVISRMGVLEAGVVLDCTITLAFFP
jgi:hypothetical protein